MITKQKLNRLAELKVERNLLIMGNEDIEIGTPFCIKNIALPTKAIQKAYWEHYKEIEG